MCDDSPLRRPSDGQPRAANDRLRADELTEFGRGAAGIVRIPDGASAEHPAPIILVSPERYGLVQHTVDVADRFAQHGWAAISPDFYADIAETDAGHLPPLSDKVVLDHIRSALTYLRDDPRCDSSRVAVYGVCRSGSWGLLASAELPEVQGVIMLYGGAGPREYVVDANRPRDYREIIAASPSPILGIFGERDHTMSIDDVTALRDTFEQAKRSYDLTIVRDMPHGWINDTMPGRFRADITNETWSQMLGFLDKIARPDDSTDVRWQFRSRFAADYDFATNTRQE